MKPAAPQLRAVEGSTPFGSTLPFLTAYLALAQPNYARPSAGDPGLLQWFCSGRLRGSPRTDRHDVAGRSPVVAGTLAGTPEIVEVDDVVSPEHRLGAVPGPEHDGVGVVKFL